MLGPMLARAGVEVVVLKKYPDFFREFPKEAGDPDGAFGPVVPARFCR
jgi:hypothetical protein